MLPVGVTRALCARSAASPRQGTGFASAARGGPVTPAATPRAFRARRPNPGAQSERHDMNDRIKSLSKLLTGLSPRHDTFTVFSDFVAMTATSISNAVDRTNSAAREAAYMAIIKRYDRKEDLEVFPRAFAELTLALEDDMSDVLGRVFHELSLQNKWAGQFFTPDHICRLMAGISLTDDLKQTIKDRGFIHASEPCVGSGAMIIALAHAMREAGFNQQQTLHVTAVDVDIRAVHMAYIQLSLLHIPAVIVHGNALTLEEWSHWHTPARVLGGWRFRIEPDKVTGIIADSAPKAAGAPRGKGQLELF
jgi:hypothetical protein